MMQNRTWYVTFIKEGKRGIAKIKLPMVFNNRILDNTLEGAERYAETVMPESKGYQDKVVYSGNVVSF